ncbi:conserved Plasmodium protein, unknown function [Plasmodium sp. gorilla clade G2]|uniref:conserved Plasmodium protein, unknown function n=1 Tax=Plasmodium sp. gorilla clade G2 TaxID=880535 RepID=UPI000D209F35|nr:conserved Plasmodium protein, unknown function [Plasmodium sp. gorilla clade G2]SOV18643.1 conserved Plasmodium protein, unknown function [Plasmodium sp. gorilla clade G2]
MYTFEKKEEERYLTKAIYAYGINKNIYNPFYLLDDNLIFYCVGTNGVLHSIIEKKQTFLLSHENSYGIICLGISSDKKLLALGEKSVNKPYISIFSNNTHKLIKRLTLEISDNASRIMNICFSSKNKYIYCITNGNTKSLFLCYDWLKEKLMFSKIFPFSLFSNICGIYINPHNSSYIALLSISVLKNIIDIDSINDEGKTEVCVSIDNDKNIKDPKKETIKNKDNYNIDNINNIDGIVSNYEVRNIFLYHNVDKNLDDIVIKNKKLEKIDNNFTNCCWLNDGILLLINKNNYIIFYDVKKEKLKIYNKHVSSQEIIKVISMNKGFSVFDNYFIYIYEKSPDLSVHLCYLLKYYIRFNYNILYNSYCLFSSCEKMLYFLEKDGNIKRYDVSKRKVLFVNNEKVNYESLRNKTNKKEDLKYINKKDDLKNINNKDDLKNTNNKDDLKNTNNKDDLKNTNNKDDLKNTNNKDDLKNTKNKDHLNNTNKECDENDLIHNSNNNFDNINNTSYIHKSCNGNFSGDENGKEEDNFDLETVVYNIGSSRINDFDVCLKHPLIILCYDDNMIRIVNYRKKEVVLENSFNNEPLHLSIHCSGHLLMVAFTDKLRIFHILYNKLKIKKEFFLKNCSCCKYSNGGNFMAVSKISTIYIYKTYTYELLYVLKSHVNYISDIIWSNNDFSIFSIGQDGYFFEYSLYNNGNKMIEVLQKEKKFLCIDLEFLDDMNKKNFNGECNNLDKKQKKYDNEYKSLNNLTSNEIKNIYISSDDKTIKQFCNSKMECVLECEYIINKILLYKNKFLIATYHNGYFSRIRFYTLPLSGIYLEIPCHILTCVNLKFDINMELLFSCSKDGSIYIFSIEKVENAFIFSQNMKNNQIDMNKQIYSKDNIYNQHDQNDTINVYADNNNTNEIYEDNMKTKRDILNYDDIDRINKIENKKKNVHMNNTNDCNNNNNNNNNNKCDTFNSTIPNNNGGDLDDHLRSPKELCLSDFNNDSFKNDNNKNVNLSKEQMKLLQNNILLYDLSNRINYSLNEEEKDNEEILIDFFYVQKKNKEYLELEKKINNLKNQMDLEMKNKESIYKNELKKLKKEKNLEIKNLIKINKSLVKEKEKMENTCKESLYELEEKHTYFVNQLNSQFYLTNKICEEKFLKVQEEFDLYKKNSTTEILELKDQHQIQLKELQREKDEQVQKKEDYLQNCIMKYDNLQKEKEQYIKQMEEEVDEEILMITKKYENQIEQLKKDKYDLMGKFKLYEHIESELKENIQEEKDKFIKNNITAKRLHENIDNLKVDLSNLKDNIATKEKEIESKNSEIMNLNKKNEELEKVKIVLTQKIKNLESNLSPKESEIKIMREKIDEMAKCFENNHKKRVNLQIEINEYKMKIKFLHDDLLNYNKTIMNYEKILKNLQDHIKECYLHLHDKKIFNSSFLNLYNKFHKVNDVQNYDAKNVFSEYIRQKEYLENMIEVLKDKLHKETEAFRNEKIKMMNENSLLLKEINDLKMDLNFLKSECHEAQLQNRKMKFLKKRSESKERKKEKKKNKEDNEEKNIDIQ